MKNIFLILFFINLIQLKAILGQENKNEEYKKTVEWDLNYTGDIARNFVGGKAVGNAYMGLLKGDITLNMDKFWKGGKFKLEIMNTHGKNLSENYIGDLQIASNIENGNYTFLEKLYFEQKISKLTFLIGLQDLNENFCVNEYGGSLTNSSFGIHSTFPLNFGVPIYPKTALAIASYIYFTDKFFLRAAIFDGDAGSLDEDKHNLDWSISKEDGLLWITEGEYIPNTEKLTDIKVGFFYHTANFISQSDSTIIKGNYGFHGIINKEILTINSLKTGLFGQVAYFPSKANFNNLYLGGGLNFSGISAKRPDDYLALGFAYAQIYKKTAECDIEINYCFSVGNHFSLQPCFHYIINPGANQGYKNSLAGFLRFSIFK
jgi:porin